MKSENLEINEEFSKIIQQYDDEVSKENIVLNKIKMFKRNTVSPKERWINLLKGIRIHYTNIPEKNILYAHYLVSYIF